jgi:hypothetical protein
MKGDMRCTVSRLATAILLLATATLPTSPALAADTLEPHEQIVGLQIVYVPPGVDLPDRPRPNGTVYGDCGWASMWVNTSGTHRARFEADSGSYIGFMTRVDWTISWSNADTGAVICQGLRPWDWEEVP